jgi:hypothetical protein
MVYRATQDVVRRVMPLLDRMANQSIDKARLLQYLSAMAGQEWGVLELVADTGVDRGDQRALTFRDRLSGAEHTIAYPACLLRLPEPLEPLVREEYRRLAMDRPLTTMHPDLFAYFYQSTACDRCRWRGPAYTQFHRECHFAGHPVNFEPDPGTAA